MSIFKRIQDVVRSNVNSALDSAEDPRKVLEQTILDMEGEYKKAKQKLLESMTLLKQTEKQAENYRKQGVDWEQKAMAALKAGSDDLARSALGEKGKVDAMALEAETGVASQKNSNEQLKEQIIGLERKIGEAKSKKDELIARLNAADMMKKQAAIASGGSAATDASAFDTFDRMVAKIENSEAEVEARAELSGMSGAAPEVDNELRKLAAKQNGEDALAALKAKMSASSGGSSGVPATTTAAPPPGGAAIDDELAKLKAKLGG
ncbi:MAG: PspA/IM30 family protein [Deltaproteobacteria bacterium]|nr:PspA/IM30 family protein [Deltaproteobacteria bacterium]